MKVKIETRSGKTNGRTYETLNWRANDEQGLFDYPNEDLTPIKQPS